MSLVLITHIERTFSSSTWTSSANTSRAGSEKSTVSPGATGKNHSPLSFRGLRKRLSEACCQVYPE